MSNHPDRVEEQELIDRMNAIRNASERNVAAMHHEAQRLVDWREHVRAQPLLAMAAATAVGFVIAHRSPRKTAVEKPKVDQSSADEVTAKASVASGVMAFVGSMASSMLKQYISGYVRNQFVGVHDDRIARGGTTASPQRSPSARRV